MTECLFCKIIKGDIAHEKVFESKKIYAFKDISPMAKEHVLFIHKEHTINVNEMSSIQVADIFLAIKEYTEAKKLDKEGFRVVTNIGDDGGQTVFHTHFHVLSGEKLRSFGA